MANVSIGGCVASPLSQEAEQQLAKMKSQKELEKLLAKENSQRDIYGFITILSLTKRRKEFKPF